MESIDSSPQTALYIPLHFRFIGVKGGTNVAPELSRVGSVIKKGRICRRGRRRRRRPGPWGRGHSSP